MFLKKLFGLQNHKYWLVLLGITIISINSPLHAKQSTEMYLVQSLGFPTHRDATPINHIMVNKVKINGKNRITIAPYNIPNSP